MQIVILSGGSGTRLWPLSNDSRSKQFLKLFQVGDSFKRESMIQRTIRLLREDDVQAEINVSAPVNQKDAIESQIIGGVRKIFEPTRRNTFAAISLSCSYLKEKCNCSDEEVVITVPCDSFTEKNYFSKIKEMEGYVRANLYEIIALGIRPTYPSAKYGYIVPADKAFTEGIQPSLLFKEKPSVSEAKELIKAGALWNSGVFAFKIGWLLKLIKNYIEVPTYENILKNYKNFPNISFDYEILEKVNSLGVIQFSGYWKDLGTWSTLTDELKNQNYGNVIKDNTIGNTHIINELNIPLLCIGTSNLIIAASPDGIIVSEKKKSENVKFFIDQLKKRPMYEERRWGKYTVLDSEEFDDGFCCLTKRLQLNQGCSISYQKHKFRDEIWTILDGEGEIVIDGERRKIKRNDTITIFKNQLHALKAHTNLTFIEVQRGKNLIEEDIERFEWEW